MQRINDPENGNCNDTYQKQDAERYKEIFKEIFHKRKQGAIYQRLKYTSMVRSLAFDKTVKSQTSDVFQRASHGQLQK